MQKIKNRFIPDTSTASGRTIYLSPFTFDSDVALEFKFKNNIPASWLIGFGSNGTSINNKALYFKISGYNQSKLSIMYQESSSATSVGLDTNISISTVFKLTTENLHKVNWYRNDVIDANRTTNSSLPLGLRLDVFNNNDYELEYVKVKPL